MLLASQYTADISGTTTTGVLLAAALSFDANYVRIVNTGTIGLRATFNSTAASTGDYAIPAGTDRELYLLTAKFSIMTTSTSTDGSDWRQARVLALGG